MLRVNEQTVLAMVHTLFVREHNRIASELGKINPQWNDETVFQVKKLRFKRNICRVKYIWYSAIQKLKNHSSNKP